MARVVGIISSGVGRHTLWQGGVVVVAEGVAAAMAGSGGGWGQAGRQQHQAEDVGHAAALGGTHREHRGAEYSTGGGGLGCDSGYGGGYGGVGGGGGDGKG